MCSAWEPCGAAVQGAAKSAPSPRAAPRGTASELECLEELAIRSRIGQIAGRVVRRLLFDVRRLLLQRGHRSQKLLEIENTRPQARVLRAVVHGILQMETPEAVGIFLQVLHRIAAPDQHVADVELEPSDCGIEAFDEEVEGHLAVDRLLVVGLIMEGEPDSGLPRHRAGGVEAIGPFAPVVQRLLGPIFEIGHDEILVAQQLRRLEAPLPADENGVGGHVRRRRPQPLALQGRGNLRRRAAEEIKRPEQLHIGVAHRVHRSEGFFGILRHGVANRVRLETDALQLLGGWTQGNPGDHPARRGGSHRLKKVASFHGANLRFAEHLGEQYHIGMINVLTLIALVAVQDTSVAVIPQPAHMTRATGTFLLTPATVVVTDRATRDIGYQLADWLRPATGYRLAVGGTAGAAARVISLRLDSTLAR